MVGGWVYSYRDVFSAMSAIVSISRACTNPDCSYNIKIRNGDLFVDEPLNDGQLHMSRR